MLSRAIHDGRKAALVAVVAAGAIAGIIVSYSRGDLRVDSSGPALAALRSSLGSPLYASSREALLSTSLDRGR